MESKVGLRQLLEEWEIPGDSACALKLELYLALLTKWNARINLTASTEWHVLGPMFREAIWAAQVYPRESIAHLDIGSGAGFPALLLKMLIPRLQLELVESRERKSQFLETAASHLGLDNVKVRQARLSDYLHQCPVDRRWDCISWKALKLAAEDLRQLHDRRLAGTQFWMFHGKEPALESAEALQMFRLERKERIPGMKESYLSMYRAVSLVP